MKKLLIVLSCLFLVTVVGCLATKFVLIEKDTNGNIVRQIEAEDYSITSPTVVAVPSRWLTPDFVGTIFENLLGVWTKSIPIVNKPTTKPTETTTPTETKPVVIPTVNPGPYPAPVTPTPVVTPVTPAPVLGTSVFTQNGNHFTLDLDTVPTAMRKAGFDGSDNALWYTLAYVYAYGPGQTMPDDDAGSLKVLNTQRQQIYNWFDSEVSKIKTMFKNNSNFKMTVITNDGKDRCGFRLGPAIMDKLMEFGSRIQLGQTLSPNEYDRKIK